MGLAYFICAEYPVEGVAERTPDGKALAQASDHLEALAQGAGVPGLFEFLSVDPATAAALGGWEDADSDDEPDDLADDEFADDEEAEDDPPSPAEQWFAAEDGLTTIEALIQGVEADPDALAAELGTWIKPADVVAELNEFAAILHRLAAAGVRWHLGIDF